MDVLCFSSRVGLSLLTLSLLASNERKKEFGLFFFFFFSPVETNRKTSTAQFDFILMK